MDAQAPPHAESMLENRTFGEIAIGDSASLTKTIRREDIELFAVVTGDVNPTSLDPVFAATDIFHGIVAHGMLGAGVISALLGTRLPGPGRSISARICASCARSGSAIRSPRP